MVPIEVKSGKSGTLKSLHQFMYEKKQDHAFRFDVLPPSTQYVQSEVSTVTGQHQVAYTLHSLPFYAVELLPKLLDQLRDR